MDDIPVENIKTLVDTIKEERVSIINRNK